MERTAPTLLDHLAQRRRGRDSVEELPLRTRSKYKGNTTRNADSIIEDGIRVERDVDVVSERGQDEDGDEAHEITPKSSVH